MIEPVSNAEIIKTTIRMNRLAREAGIEPINAICTGRHRHEWTDESGNGRIRAPSLKNVQCFWCGAKLKPHPGFAATPTLKPALSIRAEQLELIP